MVNMIQKLRWVWLFNDCNKIIFKAKQISKNYSLLITKGDNLHLTVRVKGIKSTFGVCGIYFSSVYVIWCTQRSSFFLKMRMHTFKIKHKKVSVIKFHKNICSAVEMGMCYSLHLFRASQRQNRGSTCTHFMYIWCVKIISRTSRLWVVYVYQAEEEACFINISNHI